MQDRFEKFLLENNCYSQFVTNLLEQKNLTIPEFIESEPDPRLLVMHAFVWNRTPEGADFWLEIFHKWEI